MNKVMLARQPIFDAHQKTYAYELLYRGESMDIDGDTMTATVLSHTLNRFGIETMAHGRPIFINLSKTFLLSDLPEILPHNATVLEVLEDVPADKEVIAAIQHWKEQGFTVALDDFISITSDHMKLLPYVDIVKIDILDCSQPLHVIVQEIRKFPIKLLAEKVETYEEYELCKKLGFDYFQGYFFSKPTIIINSHALETSKAQLLQLLSRVLEADSPKDLETDIAHDLTLSYKLLCYINSASVGLKKKIDSIGHALTLLGLKKLRAWISMMLMASLSTGKPDALLALSFIRGRFLEQLALAKHDDKHSSDYFILGMFSLLDAFLDQDIEHAIESVSLPKLVHEGLLDKTSSANNHLRLIQALEQGDWAQVDTLCDTVDVDSEQIMSLYAEAIQWSDERVATIHSLSA
ncbi:MAG: hypothetical protein COB41_00855 [Proteobacteria bacterium]|nr:MAG: hypothetical protein COB41_00855 [Pseudomonadota bacterium]